MEITILVVDDEPSMREFLGILLTREGYRVDQAESALTALDLLATTSYDLVLSDVKMPGLDGLTFLKDLRELPLHKDTRVVMISSKDYAQDRTVASELGALEFITKPTPIRAITEVVLKYLKADPV